MSADFIFDIECFIFGPTRSECGLVEYKIENTEYKTSNGFSLIEFLVVVAIIAVVAAVLFPVVTSAKQNAKRTKCSSNLKQILAAWSLYADDYSGRACPSYYFDMGTNTEYAWDFALTWTSNPPKYKFGLLGPYARSHEIKSCPSFKGGTAGRPYTGYAYNATYIGGDSYAGVPPCGIGEIAKPSRKAVFADAGYSNPVVAHNYLRSPNDPLFTAGKVHFRHGGFAEVAYADGHVAATGKKFRYDPREPECGALSEDESAYWLR